MDKHDDALARAAVERSMSYRPPPRASAQQVEDQKTQVENLKTALLKLQQKLAEAQAKKRRADRAAPALARAGQGHRGGLNMGDESKTAAFDRMKNKVQHSEADGAGARGPAGRRRGGAVRGDGEAAGDRPAAGGDQGQAEGGLRGLREGADVRRPPPNLMERHMTYRSKVDVWIVAAILFGWAVLLAGATGGS